MSISAPTDQLLLSAWRAGEPDAGTKLVRRHFASVSRFFTRRAYEYRVDLMQKTWLGCVESRDRVPDGLPFKIYLMGIARRVLIHHYRERQRALPTLGARAEDQAESTSSANRKLVLAEDETLLLNALRRLPLEMQLTLELFYWEGLTVDQVAAVLGIPGGTAKSRLSRARNLLRTQFECEDPPRDLVRSTKRSLEGWARSIRRALGRHSTGRGALLPDSASR